MGFVFEKDLPHQTRAVAGVMAAFEGLGVTLTTRGSQNPVLGLQGQEDTLRTNLEGLRKERGFQQAYTIDTSERVFDISMETGTGKTYTYTKTMFELNKQAGIAKFIIAVPRVAIKAGTVGFLKSNAVREHFRDAFDRDIKVYEVQSQKGSKTKKDHMPQAIADFCRADIAMNKGAIHVMVINAGMITSKTMSKLFDVALWDEFDQPFAGIAHTNPVLIVDEPHMFRRGNKTYREMMRFKPQFTLRYGATFDSDLINMVNELTAVEAFNSDLVKGIVAHVERFDEGNNVALKLTDLTGDEAKFELDEAGNKTKHVLGKGQSFETIHAKMHGLTVAAMNKSKLVLSNGLELSKGSKINPFSYAESLSDKMMQNAIQVHFKSERELFLASPRIKPLTLFFIDNIDGYRDKDGAMRLQFEAMVKAHVEALLTKETDELYKAHLQTALADIAALHGGYFSKDNSDKDDAIEKETLEILHEKERLLDFANPRRFIFSKWTLREGWDNPNVFTICKLRSSGSETSKLQEVGRGLRLPVNEYMTRDKSKNYYLNYFVDFTEADFVERLVGEINSKSNEVYDKSKLDEVLKERLLKLYPQFNNDEDELLEALVGAGIISISQKFKDGGYETLKSAYPDAFGAGLKKGKVKTGDDKPKTTIRAGQYAELKELWEKLNRKVVLEYQFENQDKLSKFFLEYLQAHFGDYAQTGAKTETITIKKMGQQVGSQTNATENQFTALSMMTYKGFLEALSERVALSVKGLHEAFVAVQAELDIDLYLSQTTLRKMHKGFNDYLLQKVFGEFSVGYRETSNKIHPTALTKASGDPKAEIESGNVGVLFEAGNTPDRYLFDEAYYDGQLELENIREDIAEVIVYSKIPKNSIRIPLIGGGSYSPDFAYVLKSSNGQSQLGLVVETKGKSENNLATLEAHKIKHAEAYFGEDAAGIDVRFETQLSDRKITEIISEVLSATV
jgi:type III restriction enzyme